MRGKDVSVLVRDLMEKGLSRRTAYYRLKGRIQHCPTCSCNESSAVTSVKRESVDNLETISIKQIKPSKAFTLCSKHGGWKNSCGCD